MYIIISLAAEPTKEAEYIFHIRIHKHNNKYKLWKWKVTGKAAAPGAKKSTIPPTEEGGAMAHIQRVV